MLVTCYIFQEKSGYIPKPSALVISLDLNLCLQTIDGCLLPKKCKQNVVEKYGPVVILFILASGNFMFESR